MAKNLDIIKKIERKLKRELVQLNFDNIVGRINGYVIEENENIVGLNLSWLGISDISFLEDLTNLTELNLYNNRISDISSLKNLKHLTHLYLCDNHISDSYFLKDLSNLTHLDLEGNQISDISSLKNLRNLIRLDLRSNKISKLPHEIFNLNMELKWKNDYSNCILLRGNPLKAPPVEIEIKGREAVKAYFKSLEGRKRALNEVKVLLVGDGGSGKTSLVKRLLGEKFEKNEPQTHGINIKHWEVNYGKDKIKVRIWDFGGQEIMHATHQFFLSKRSLYVLVLDVRKNERTEYWLKHVKTFGGDSPVLVVINKIDENPGFDINSLFLQNKYRNIKGFFRLSCATTEGIENFSRCLISELEKVELLHTTWAESWFNVKTQLEDMPYNFISYEKYKEVCQKEKITDKISHDTLVDYLNDLGVILHFKDFKLQETHVLVPKWVTTAVYKIINSKKVAESRGLLKLNLLDEILRQENTDDYYYPRDKYMYIIGLMQKFELCFELDSNTILIPDLLKIREPVFDFDYTTALRFVLEYDFLPRSIMPRFIVKMREDIKGRLNWRTGVVLENKPFQCTAVVKSDYEAKKIYIYIQGKQKREYFAVILFTLREINNSFEKLDVVENVCMPDEPEILVSYKHLILLEQRGRDYYEPDGSEKEYDIRLLLGTIDENIYIKLMVQLKNDFLAFLKLEPQQRGFEFEKFLIRIFKVFDLNPRDSFKNTGEQIDGSFQMGNDIYLVEAKWHSKEIGQADLLVFDGKISRKAKWTRGLFISISGFTKDGQEAFLKGQSASIIGMDGDDLEYILDRKLTLPEAISLKLRHAAETNEFFCPLMKLKERYADK